MWTRFMDMHSGGGTKLWLDAAGKKTEVRWRNRTGQENDGIREINKILIEAPEEEARAIFFNRFDLSPDRVTCTCCGSDYSLEQNRSLAQLTAYDRNCEYDEKTGRYLEKQDKRKMKIRRECGTKPEDKWGLYMTVKQYLLSKDVLVIRKDEIKAAERKAKIPQRGYVWCD